METIRAMKANEWDEVGSLIFKATNTWYEENGRDPVFGCSPTDLRFYCEVYEGIDPGCCLIAEVEGQIAAACFYHPRPTHISLGIMCVHPEFYGRGLAKKILIQIIEMAQKADKPLNLISSAINLDSFSLYNKSGFVTKDFYQDMIIAVPEEGLEFSSDDLSGIRPATFKDIPVMVELEKEIHSQDHGKDLQYIINDSAGNWNCHVLEEGDEIKGFLCSVNHASSNIIGLGAMKSSEDTLKLIKSHLNFFKSKSPLLLIPSKEKDLVQSFLKMKARNVELHITQAIADNPVSPSGGIILPTFLPE